MLNKHYDNLFEDELKVKVLEVIKKEDGYYHQLSDTIFYVEGGGMASDEGSIDNHKLLGLKVIDDKLYHILDTKLEGEVNLKVDLKLRIRHAAIHTAQHLMCGYINKKYLAKTISFFNDDKKAGAEMGFKELNDDIIKDIESFCNKCINEDLKVEIIYPSKEEAKQFVLEEKLNHDDLRAVKIGNIDYNMCACLHVPSLRYLNSFIIESYERTSRGYKIFFITHDLINQNYHLYFNILKNLHVNLSCPFEEVLSNVNCLIEQNNELKHRINDYKEENLNHLINNLISSSDNFIIKVFKDEDNKDLSKLVSTVVTNSHKVMIIINDLNDRMHLILAKHKSIELDLISLSNALKIKYDLKGGGNPFMIQCGGLKNDDLVDNFITIIQNML